MENSKIETHDELSNRIAQPEEPPLRIYLQWYGDGDGNWPDTDYGRDVTFSTERVYSSDVVYIRAGIKTIERLACLETLEHGVAELEAVLAELGVYPTKRLDKHGGNYKI